MNTLPISFCISIPTINALIHQHKQQNLCQPRYPDFHQRGDADLFPTEVTCPQIGGDSSIYLFFLKF